MAKISKCEICEKTILKSNSIAGSNKRPYLCSAECVNAYYEREAAIDAESLEWEIRCAKAIAKGKVESERKFEDAGDGLIMFQIDKYAYDDEYPISNA